MYELYDGLPHGTVLHTLLGQGLGVIVVPL